MNIHFQSIPDLCSQQILFPQNVSPIPDCGLFMVSIKGQFSLRLYCHSCQIHNRCTTLPCHFCSSLREASLFWGGNRNHTVWPRDIDLLNIWLALDWFSWIDFYTSISFMIWCPVNGQSVIWMRGSGQWKFTGFGSLAFAALSWYFSIFRLPLFSGIG